MVSRRSYTRHSAALVCNPGCKITVEMVMLIVLIVLIVLLLGVQPRWPYSRSWGYYPTGGVGLLLLIVLILLLLGY
jgi:Protein of unknown function (DUF3309)